MVANRDHRNKSPKIIIQRGMPRKWLCSVPGGSHLYVEKNQHFATFSIENAIIVVFL